MKKFRIVDLSAEICSEMPMRAGDLKTVIWTNITHEESKEMMKTGFSYQNRGILMGDHGPTHVDAINHISVKPEALSIDQIPLDWCFTEGVCLDLAHLQPRSHITTEELEKSLATAKLTIQKGDTVLLYTGTYNRWYGKPEYFTDYSGLDEKATRWLASKGVINIGTDAPSIDHPNDPSCPAHMICGELDILNTEKLSNLDKVANKRFLYVGLPLKIIGGTASPIRAVALFEKQ